MEETVPSVSSHVSEAKRREAEGLPLNIRAEPVILFNGSTK